MVARAVETKRRPKLEPGARQQRQLCILVVCIRASGHVLNCPVSETGESRGGERHSADGDSEGLHGTGDTWLALGGYS